jgi:hypothetical protein
MADFLIGDQQVSHDDPGFQTILERAYIEKLRPECLCSTPPLPMYIAHVGDTYVVKRMPNSGVEHAANCVSYETPPELSGRGAVDGSAIQQNGEGNVMLKFDFSLLKKAEEAEKSERSESSTAKASSPKLTMRGMLHYLWDEAGFTRWTPDDGVSKDWTWIERNLMLAAAAKEAKKTPLESLLYVPEVYDEGRKREIYQRRMQRLDPILGVANSGKRFMMLVAELEYLEANARSWFLHAKELPDFKFCMPETLYKQVNALFGQLLSLWAYIPNSHMMTIATFSVDLSGVPTIEALSLVLMSPEWIPIENNYEAQLVKELVEKKRSFVKVLRYNFPSSTPIISALLTDVKPGPVAMYLALGGLVSKGPTDDAIKALMSESTLPTWLWDVQNGVQPPLPAKVSSSHTPTNADDHAMIRDRLIELSAAAKRDRSGPRLVSAEHDEHEEERASDPRIIRPEHNEEDFVEFSDADVKGADDALAVTSPDVPASPSNVHIMTPHVAP